MRTTWQDIRSMTRFREGMLRLRSHWVYVVQAGLAAGLSYWLALFVAGHSKPFFAPMATVIVLSTTGGLRFRRAVELVVGVSLGVGLGDLFIGVVGSGAWQIALAVSLSIAIATVLDKGVLLANQAAFASVLVATILPPGTSGGYGRMLDALIGGVIGLIVLGLVPESPSRTARKEIATILSLSADVQRRVVQGLITQDTTMLSGALVEARGSQASIDAMITAALEGRETAQLSPLKRAKRPEVQEMLRVLNPVDNAMRDTRVLARRALVLVEDREDITLAQLALIGEIAQVTEELSRLYLSEERLVGSPVLEKLSKRLRKISALTTLEIVEGMGLSAQAILAQTRSLCVDLSQVCGMSRREAKTNLAPIVEHPPEWERIWNDD